MRLDRRNFLKGLGLTLLSLGIADRQFHSDAETYAHALNKFSGRKFACLIGIDIYPDVDDLAGCVNDVALQKQLLIHHFGFHPDNIFALENEEATRDNIFTIFQKKLKDLLTPDDLLLVHFSGYGTLIATSQEKSEKALMPIDGVVGQAKAAVNNAIAISTIESLVRSLNVAKAALVLDTDFQGAPRVINPYLRSRAYPKELPPTTNPSETAIQDQLERNVLQRHLDSKSVLKMDATSVGGGREFAINGTHAGLFTLTLTQYLAGINPMGTVAEASAFAEFRYQQLRLLPFQASSMGAADKTSAPLYGVLPVQVSLPHVGHVLGSDSSAIELCLLGYAPEVLQAIAPDTEVVTVGETPQTLMITTKKGLVAQAKSVTNELLPDAPLKEQLRVYPQNLTLHIALSDNLSRIERVDATSAFAGVNGVTAISNPSEWADYMFDAGYNLFSLSGQPLPARFPIESNQAIKSSVEDLQPVLEQLLALKWLRLLLNETTSTLSTQLSLEKIQTRSTPIIKKATPLNLANAQHFTNAKVNVEQGLRFRFENLEEEVLYFVGLAVNPKQEILLLTPQQAIQIPPNATTAIALDYEAQRPLGQWQVYWIGSRDPFTTLQMILARQFAELETKIVTLAQPLPLVQAILHDLSAAPLRNVSDNLKETYRLNPNRWLTCDFTYEVTEN